MKDLTESKVSSEQIFSGLLLDVRRDEVSLPEGGTSVREYIRHPGAVVIIPILPDGKILLIRQFRYPMGDVEIELPAGKIDPGEEVEETLHGMPGRIFQHENEHMNGYVFIDLVSKLKLERAEKAKDKMIKEIKRRQGAPKILH